MYQTTLKIDGMMCGMCESHINDTIRKAAPVKKVTSSHAKGEAVVLTDEPLDIEAVKAAVHATGYEVTDASSETLRKKEVLPFQEVIPFSSYRGKPLCPHAGRAVFHKAGPPGNRRACLFYTKTSASCGRTESSAPTDYRGIEVSA